MTQGYESLLLGHCLAGRYELLDLIGRGGMSVVYRGVDRTLGRPVAVKVVAVPNVSDEMRADLRARFRREAGSAAQIPHHPNVVQVYDYGTDPELDLDFIVMELLVGRDLKEALAADPPAPQRGIRILREAARGLAAGHRVGIVHRDVKPANLFLVREGDEESVRVLDFGIAKPLDPNPQADLTRTGQFAYSPAYASPEQLRGERGVAPSSDVYQLGLIGYELLSGERPFDEAQRLRIADGERLDVPVRGRWMHAPSALRATLERALRMEPGERFADAAELAEALSGRDVDWDETVFEGGARPVAVPTPDGQAPAGEPAPRPAEPLRVPGVPVGVSGMGGEPARSGTRPGLSVPPARWAIPILIAAVLLIVLLRGLARRDDPADGSVAAATTSGTLLGGSDPGGGSGGVVMEGGAEGEAQRAVIALNRAWVDGDLTEHVGHYASRVDYYNSRRLPRSGVRRDRRRELERYPERRIDIREMNAELLERDRVRVRVRKSWRFAGPERGEHTGSGLQEYVLKRDDDDGKWYVVSEHYLEQTEKHTPPPGGEEEDG